MTKANYSKYVVLGLLSGGPMSGYEIKKWVDECFKYLLMDISYGQIYPMLGRLDQEGLASMSEKRSGKSRIKKIYRITEKGMDELVAWIRSPDLKEYDVLIKLCFGSLITPEEIIAKLDLYRKKREADLALIKQYTVESGSEAIYGPNTPYLMMIMTLGGSYFREEVAWCEDVIKMLAEKK